MTITKPIITVVNKYKTDENYVYIGRGSVYGNPFKMNHEKEREKVCGLYREYFYKELETNQIFKTAINLLINKAINAKYLNLACFCAPKQCHGDIIKEYIDQQIALTLK